MSGGVCEPRQEKEARNIAQRYAIFSFCVKTRWQCHHNTRKTSAGLWRWCNVKSTSLSLAKNVFWRQNSSWRWAAQRMTVSNVDKWQHSTGKRTCSIWSKINSQNDCWWNEHEPGNRSFDTEWRIGDEKNLCQNGAHESHRSIAGWAQFLYPNVLRRGCSLLTHLISHFATSFYFKKKINSERTPFWVNGRHPEGCNAGLKRRPSSCVPGMLQRMAAPLEKMCAGTGVHFEGEYIVVDE